MIFDTKAAKFTLKNVFFLSLLIAAGAILIFSLVPGDCWFGSKTDWYSQHVTIADYMRKNFYATGQLFPDFTGLGGGTDFYSLSYYGFMRPDVLLSYCFPNLPVAFFIQGYAIFEILFGGGLLYYWLHKKGFSDFTSFVCGFFYLTANCFFQAHRQIIFVNYLPFVILAFLCLDKILNPEKASLYSIRPHIGLIFSLFFCILHSFYFFPSCFVACILYICHLLPQFKNGMVKSCQTGKIWWNYILDVSLAVSMNLFLLLPTGLAILGNKKDVGTSTSLLKLFGVNPTMDSILYSPYGCGLAVFCLYALFLCIREKKTRKLAIAIFILLFFDIFYWILNATLYVRPKCLIPFLPLILYLTAQVLEGLRKKEIQHSLPLALLCGIPVSVQLIFLLVNKTVRHLVIADFVLLLIMVILSIFVSKKQLAFSRHPLIANIVGILFLCTTPAMLYLAKGGEEEYASVSDDSRDYFSQEDLEKYCENPQARFDITEHPSNNTNYVISGDQNKSTIYSSISNSTYNTLLYDVLRMPISIRNRVAMTADVNPFQEYLMGVRYLQTIKEKVPAGYSVLQEKDGHVLTENKNVLPLAYGSTACMYQSYYDQLSYPENLDALVNRTIIPDASDAFADIVDTKDTASSENVNSSTNIATASYHSQMESYQLPENFFIHKIQRKNVTVRRELPKTLKAGTILLLSFDVDYNGAKDISIVINGIRNRLSGSEAPYPNNNTTFTYMISRDEDMDFLEITFSSGSYRIKNATAYTIPLSAISHPGIVEFKEQKTKGKQIAAGNITMPEDGYFVTSYTFSQGYKALVDGKDVATVQVNNAFVGFPLQKGTHEIILEYHAPGKTVGIILSCAALMVLIAWNLLYFLFKHFRKL